MFKDIFLKITEPEYRDLPYTSYSTIKSFIKEGPKGLRDKKKISSIYIDYGNLVELLLMDLKKFYIKFYVTDIKIPVDILKEGIENLYESKIMDIEFIYPTDEEILIATADWDKRITKKETRLNKLKEKVLPYFDELIKAKNRTIISNEMYYQARLGVENIKNHYYCKDLLTSKENIEILFQVPIVVKINNIDIKILIDWLYIDHYNKIIIPIDLKTGGFHNNTFEFTFWKNMYHIQGSLYSTVLIKFLKENKIFDYSYKPFTFIYLSSLTNTVTIHPLSKEILQATWNGYKKGDFYFKGLNKYIELIQWHKDNFEFTYDKEIIDNKDIIPIKVPLTMIIC